MIFIFSKMRFHINLVNSFNAINILFWFIFNIYFWKDQFNKCSMRLIAFFSEVIMNFIRWRYIFFPKSQMIIDFKFSCELLMILIYLEKRRSKTHSKNLLFSAITLVLNKFHLVRKNKSYNIFYLMIRSQLGK